MVITLAGGLGLDSGGHFNYFACQCDPGGYSAIAG